MENSDLLPFVVQLDDSDEPGDVLDSLALAPFVAGHHPYARTRQLSRFRTDANFVPQGASSFRSAHGSWRSIVLSQGHGWTLKAEWWQDGTACLTVTAISERLAEDVISEVCTSIAEPPEPAESTTPLGFWHSGNRGAERSERSIDSTPWS